MSVDSKTDLSLSRSRLTYSKDGCFHLFLFKCVPCLAAQSAVTSIIGDLSLVARVLYVPTNCNANYGGPSWQRQEEEEEGICLSALCGLRCRAEPRLVVVSISIRHPHGRRRRQLSSSKMKKPLAVHTDPIRPESPTNNSSCLPGKLTLLCLLASLYSRCGYLACRSTEQCCVILESSSRLLTVFNFLLRSVSDCALAPTRHHKYQVYHSLGVTGYVTTGR